MSNIPSNETELREKIIAQPDLVLDDMDVMQALAAANAQTMGDNVFDLRAVAMNRLETRLNQAEDTHKTVVAAAYENMASTNQIQRAVLRILDERNLSGLLFALEKDVLDILRLDAIRLIIERNLGDALPANIAECAVIAEAEPGFSVGYFTRGRGAHAKQVILRKRKSDDPDIYEAASERIGSEACMLLEIGPLKGLLALGMESTDYFNPQQGTELLAFLGGVVERELRRYLA